MATPPNSRQLPSGLRWAGLWIIWSAWCSASGWLLSAANELDALGYLVLSPVLVGCGWLWIKSTSRAAVWPANPMAKFIRRFRRPAPVIYLCIVVLSLLAGFLYAPWNFDANTYRLPRVLYWWWAHHWYWIGTLDHRLDYSSVGFEWQMLPLMQLTRGDRFLFLINWVPFLLMPGLVFTVFRAFGVTGRSARRWMWLLPAGYCYALQSSGLGNDGYAANYLLAAVGFAAVAYHARCPSAFWLALLSTALMTGAKLSNVPLLLPVGILLLAAMPRVPWLGWRLAAVGIIAILCSCLPLGFLAWQKTGDWTGDPADQWHAKAHRPAGAVVLNLLQVCQDATQPPLLPGNESLNAALRPLNESGFVRWLQQSGGDFKQFRYAAAACSITAGPGFGLGLYCAFLLGGICVVRRRTAGWPILPLAWRVAPWLAWVSYGVCLAVLGSHDSPRILAPYYPLLLVALIRMPRVACWERRRFSARVAGLAAATAIPIIILAPLQPLVPVQTLASRVHYPAFQRTAAAYGVWEHLRDDLAPLRGQLPGEASRLGYGAGLSDSPYGLVQPLGSRELVELGLPLGHAPLAPKGLRYVVVTNRGLQERFHLDLNGWLDGVRGKILFTFDRTIALDAHSTPLIESWYLVDLNP